MAETEQRIAIDDADIRDLPARFAEFVRAPREASSRRGLQVLVNEPLGGSPGAESTGRGFALAVGAVAG